MTYAIKNPRGRNCNARKCKTPHQSTLETLRANGLACDTAEQWKHGGRRVDLFGFIDIVAIDVERKEFVAIQATSGSNGAARVKKITGECSCEAKAWLRAKGRIEVWAWRELKDEGWTPKITDVLLNPKTGTLYPKPRDE